jgi:hypothetical protein
MLGRKNQKSPQFASNSALDKEFNLLENFSTICVNKCITANLEQDVDHGEKICIGKCMDRAYEYLRIL